MKKVTCLVIYLQFVGFRKTPQREFYVFILFIFLFSMKNLNGTPYCLLIFFFLLIPGEFSVQITYTHSFITISFACSLQAFDTNFSFFFLITKILSLFKNALNQLRYEKFTMKLWNPQLNISPPPSNCLDFRKMPFITHPTASQKLSYVFFTIHFFFFIVSCPYTYRGLLQSGPD